MRTNCRESGVCEGADRVFLEQSVMENSGLISWRLSQNWFSASVSKQRQQIHFFFEDTVNKGFKWVNLFCSYYVRINRICILEARFRDFFQIFWREAVVEVGNGEKVN